MNDWPRISLGDLISLERRPVKVVADGQYPEIGIYCFGKGIFHKQPRSGLEVGDKDLFLIREGDLILQVTFAWEGAIALCSRAEDGLYGSTRYPTFRVNEPRAYPPFLARYLCARDGLEQVNRICPGSAGRNRVLSMKRIPEITIPLPPLPEQRRIVARIEELAAKIEEARGLREIANRETDALEVSVRSSCCPSPAGQSMTVAELIKPDSLRNGKSITTCETPSSIRCLTLSGVRRGDIDTRLSKPVPIDEAEARPFLIRPGEVFIVRGNGSKSLCGQAALAHETVGMVMFPDLLIRVPLPRDRILPEFFVAVWNSAMIRSAVEEKAKTTSGIWKINQGHIESIALPVPPVPEQQRIVAKLDALQSKVDALKRLQSETAAELDALLPSILDKAFKGEL